jgi:aminopeptidase N
LLFSNILVSQRTFTKKDSLRGAMRTERNYNVSFYDLKITFDIPEKSISGMVEMQFTANQDLSEIQVDLFENMKINKITAGNKELKYRREHDAVFISGAFKKNEFSSVKIQYEGIPRIAKNAPWDGGFTWSKDNNGKPWVGVSCEGTGASLWWPNKDHLSDEPEKGMNIQLTVPSDLMAISNGKLISVTDESKNQKTYQWKVSYPINNYNVSFYIGDYIHFDDQYKSFDGSLLTMNYYVLKDNLDKARNHFEQTKKMLESFEFYFGKYPFWNDGYALVESPYLGMEHQSAIAYGNQFQRGYLGGRIPDEFNFDFIILHESGHEYFGNAVSCNDLADMWIHEGFTTYMESLYVEYLFGRKAALRYLNYQRSFIKNQFPLIGPREVNFDEFPDNDIYYKGSWVLQTLRFAIKNDSLWFDLIKGFYNTYKYKNIDSKDFFQFVNDYTKKDYSPFFTQYFYKAELPKLHVSISVDGTKTLILYKFESVAEEFELPVEISLDGKVIQLDGSAKEKNIEFNKVFRSVKAVNNQSLIEIITTP